VAKKQPSSKNAIIAKVMCATPASKVPRGKKLARDIFARAAGATWAKEKNTKALTRFFDFTKALTRVFDFQF
jgi:hypothetical protein